MLIMRSLFKLEIPFVVIINVDFFFFFFLLFKVVRFIFKTAFISFLT